MSERPLKLRMDRARAASKEDRVSGAKTVWERQTAMAEREAMERDLAAGLLEASPTDVIDLAVSMLVESARYEAEASSASKIKKLEEETAALREELERERRRTADAATFVRSLRDTYVGRRTSYINGETQMQRAVPHGADSDFKLETIHAGGVLDGPIGAYNHAVGDMSTLLHILDGKGGK